MYITEIIISENMTLTSRPYTSRDIAGNALYNAAKVALYKGNSTIRYPSGLYWPVWPFEKSSSRGLSKSNDPSTKLRPTAAVSACLQECQSAIGLLILYTLKPPAITNIMQRTMQSRRVHAFFADIILSQSFSNPV